MRQKEVPRILVVLCTAYSTAIASEKAWKRLLRRHGFSEEEIRDALKQYMVRVGEYEFMVDRDKCLEVIG